MDLFLKNIMEVFLVAKIYLLKHLGKKHYQIMKAKEKLLTQL